MPRRFHPACTRASIAQLAGTSPEGAPSRCVWWGSFCCCLVQKQAAEILHFCFCRGKRLDHDLHFSLPIKPHSHADLCALANSWAQAAPHPILHLRRECWLTALWSSSDTRSQSFLDRQ